MTKQELIDTVAREIENATEMYLTEIIDHGIHNLTNDFQGETDEEYYEFEQEFDRQAREKLSGD